VRIRQRLFESLPERERRVIKVQRAAHATKVHRPTPIANALGEIEPSTRRRANERQVLEGILEYTPRV